MTDMDLFDFLLARIAEDEKAAHRAAFGYGPVWTQVADHAEDWTVVHADGQRDMVGCEDGDVTQHIARHDPARVLAECEAKRRIVAWCSERNQVSIGPIGSDPTDPANYIPGQYTHLADAPVLRLLTLPYASHPDYEQQWRP